MRLDRKKQLKLFQRNLKRVFFWKLGTDRVFYLSMAVSILLHSLILGTLFLMNFRLDKKIKKKMEMVYYSEIRQVKLPAVSPVEVKAIKSKNWMPEPKIFSKRENRPLPEMKEALKQNVRLDGEKKVSPSLPSLMPKRQINVPFIKSEKITNPKYLSYQEMIRNKIRNRAYLYRNSPDFENGEVYIGFVLSADGSLSSVKVVEDKTRANNYIRSIALKSVKEASPFPPFPADWSYPEIPFNIIISFETGE